MRDVSGKIRWSVKMTEEERLAATPFPCGRCLPCKINKARVWTHRILLEHMVHSASTFVTLTYSDEFLPKDGNLSTRDFTLFMKRLRRKFEHLQLRFYGVGEYGSNTRRPHYHLAIFGIGPEYHDYVSKIWGKGHVLCGDLNKNSARYITGYIIQKMTKEGDPRLQGLKPEFFRSSRRPGIGLPAIFEIAKNIRKNKSYENGGVIREFKYGKKTLPLGGYLTHKLAHLLGVPDYQFQTDFWEYQQEIFNKHESLSDNFYFSIVDEFENERIIQEKKFKIYKQKRDL